MVLDFSKFSGLEQLGLVPITTSGTFESNDWNALMSIPHTPALVYFPLPVPLEEIAVTSICRVGCKLLSHKTNEKSSFLKTFNNNVGM